MQSPQHQPVALLQPSGTSRQHAAVLGAYWAGPDHVEIAWSKLGQRLPAANVAQMVGLALGSTSSEVTSQPSSSKALPIEPVPENNSSRRCGMGSSKIFFFHDGVKGQPHQSNKSCAIAGETEVAEQRLSPVQLVGHLFFVDGIRKETDRRKLGNSFPNGSPTWRRSHQPEGR